MSNIVVEKENGEVVVVEKKIEINQISETPAVWGEIAGNLSDQLDILTELSYKVDKVPGKVLSSNDYTTADKTKLAGIEPGAQANVVPTWGSVTDKPAAFPPEDHDHNHNDLTGLNTGEYQHLTQDEQQKLQTAVISTDIAEIVTLTQTEYNAITPAATSLYIITGA